MVKATQSHVRRDVSEIGSGAKRVDTMRVSGMASFMSRLKSLQEADPDRSKQVLSQIAGHVREQALAQGGRAGDKLAQFADKLDAAAASGEAVMLSRKTRSAAEEMGPAIADKLETYASYQDAASAGSAASFEGPNDAFFEGLTDALARALASANSDDALQHVPEPAQPPMMLGTAEATPGTPAQPPPEPAVLGAEEGEKPKFGGQLLKEFVA